MENMNNKDFFKKYGIFVLILIISFGVLSYSIILSRKSWNNNLRTAVVKVLDEYEPDVWSIENTYQIKSPISISSAAYEARSKKNGELYKIIIIRINTFYGPIPAVFSCDAQNNVSFIGYSSLHGRINSQLRENLVDKRVEYWMKKVPEILYGGE